MKSNKILAIAVSSAMLLPATVFATNGMIPMGFGSKAKGMGGASIALPQEATAAANNPAGMVHIGNRIDFGAEIFAPDRTGEIEGNQFGVQQFGFPAGVMDFKETANNDPVALIPEGGFNMMINNQTSFGVSVVGVGGMNTNYDSIALFNGAAGPNETGIDLLQLKIIPTIAYKFNDKHSVGIGVELGYQMFKAYGLQAFTGTGTPPNCFGDGSCAASSSPSNVTNNGYDSAFGIGFTLGWQGQITDQLTLGATYHSKNNVQEFDDYRGLFAGQGSLDMPGWYGFGLAYKATPKLTIALDYTRTLYSGVDAISNDLVISAPQGFPSGANMFMPGTMLGDDNGSGFGWNDINTFKLGMAYEVNSVWTVRAGWNHSDNPIDKDQTFFNLLAPATITDHLTAGATYTLANKSELTFHGYYAFNSKVNGKGSIPQAFGGGEANIEMSQIAFGVQYGWNF